MSRFTFTIPESQVAAIHRLAASHCEALKNWMASAVEAGDLPRAQSLAKELRQHQAIFAATNLSAKYAIAETKGVPVDRVVDMQEERS